MGHNHTTLDDTTIKKIKSIIKSASLLAFKDYASTRCQGTTRPDP